MLAGVPNQEADEALERVIETACRALVKATDPDEQRDFADIMNRLIKQRSDEQVTRMEREKFGKAMR